VVLALIGGFLGSYYGSLKWNSVKLNYVLAGVLALASIKMFWV
jgi:uncharacterized membrane protein YfcA